MCAEIVAFPARRVTAVEAGDLGRERLRRALDGLNAASAQQRLAVSGWRQALSDLQVSMRGLEARLGVFQGQLGGLQTDVAGLREDATRLERWASSAARREQGGSGT